LIDNAIEELFIIDEAYNKAFKTGEYDIAKILEKMDSSCLSFCQWYLSRIMNIKKYIFIFIITLIKHKYLN